MFRNYMMTALRNLLRYRQYTLINIFGLAVGLAACILILLYVNFELSYDRWIPNNDRVMRVETRFYNDAGQPNGHSETVPPVAGPIFRDQITDIELAARFLNQGVALAVDGKAFEQQVTISDPDVFELMGVSLVEGNPDTALDSPDALVLSQSDAHRIFGEGSVLGKTVKVDGQHLLQVTGVMPDWPNASDLEVNGFVPMSSPVIGHMPWLQTEWGSFWGPTYIRIREGVTHEQVAEQINALAQRVGPPERFKDRLDKGIKPAYDFYLTQAADAHLKSNPDWGTARGSATNLAAATTVAFLILVIAVINVANLGTMLAMKRVREVAIRKALGARGRHLMAQVMMEAVCLTVLSMLIGIAFAEALLPTFSDLMNRALSTDLLYQPATMLVLLTGTVVVGTVCGLYPALVATRFRPVDYLSGMKPKLGSNLRDTLIVLQFAATIALLVTCLVVFMQAEYARNNGRGFDSEQLVEISGIERPVVLERESAFRQALGRIPGVTAVAAAHGMPGHDYNNNNGVTLDNGKQVTLRRFAVSEELLPMLDVTPLAGRLFSKDRPIDSVTELDKGASRSIIINDLALKELEIATPEEAIGKSVRTWGDFRSTIIGVVPNLRTRSARQEPSATYYWVGPHEFRHVVLKVSEADITATLAQVDRVWHDFFPELPIRRQFVDDAFADYYDGERRQGWLLLFSACVTVVIAGMGLYGLAALATERRSKEIGVRKVLGARTFNIVQLLLWQFSIPVLLANLIAWPIAWWGLNEWLEKFVDRIDLSLLPFLVAGLGVLLFAWITIIGHTLKVARSNPINALRYE